MDKSNRIILFFVKFPDPGRVKTRLSHALGAQRGAAIYMNFVSDMLDTLILSEYPFGVCFEPQTRMEAFKSWLGSGRLYIPQKGTDLGERMKKGFQDAFRMGYKKVILIGSDFPDLPPEIIVEAFSALERHPAVIGPALDGGYYLIGFGNDTFEPGVFDKITWGDNTVFQKTLSSFKAKQQSAHILPVWNDIDTYEDLLDLYRRGKGTRFSRSKTMAYLASLFDTDNQWGAPID